jgi:hypothetical protein
LCACLCAHLCVREYTVFVLRVLPEGFLERGMRLVGNTSHVVSTMLPQHVAGVRSRGCLFMEDALSKSKTSTLPLQQVGVSYIELERDVVFRRA